MTTAPVWIECSAIGCANGISVYWRHADNFIDRYFCAEHPEFEEVPC